MYCTPCARLMKSITPKTSVRPAAIRNSSTPSCRPLSVWTMRRVTLMRCIFPLGPPSGERVPSEQREARRERGVCSHQLPSPGLPSSLRFGGSPPSPASGRGEERRRRRAASLHRTILHVRIRVVLEHLLHDLGLEFAVAALRHLDQIEVLDRVVVCVELESAAQRFEIRLPYGGA